MKSAALPDNERERLAALRTLTVLDSSPEQGFDDLTLLAATICDTPVALVSLVDEHRQWFKSHHGIELDQTDRDVSFCAHAILESDRVLEVPDATLDSRFADNPLVTGAQQFRFYAGAPLVTDEGYALGTLCVLDHRPRRLEPRQRAALEALARQAAAQLKLRSMHRALQDALESARSYQNELEEYQTRLRHLNMQLHAQAVTDPLTGLYNRLALTQQLNQAVARCHRSGEYLSLLLIDADHFKSYNDRFGHQVGDVILRQLATVIRSVVRESDIAARYGGEEFVVILPGTDGEGALALAERVRMKVQSSHCGESDLTVSIGVVSRRGAHPRCTAELLIQDADAALYRAKDSGRNRVIAAVTISA